MCALDAVPPAQGSGGVHARGLGQQPGNRPPLQQPPRLWAQRPADQQPPAGQPDHGGGAVSGRDGPGGRRAAPPARPPPSSPGPSTLAFPAFPASQMSCCPLPPGPPAAATSVATGYTAGCRLAGASRAPGPASSACPGRRPPAWQHAPGRALCPCPDIPGSSAHRRPRPHARGLATQVRQPQQQCVGRRAAQQLERAQRFSSKAHHVREGGMGRRWWWWWGKGGLVARMPVAAVAACPAACGHLLLLPLLLLPLLLLLQCPLLAATVGPSTPAPAADSTPLALAPTGHTANCCRATPGCVAPRLAAVPTSRP